MGDDDDVGSQRRTGDGQDGSGGRGCKKLVHMWFSSLEIGRRGTPPPCPALPRRTSASPPAGRGGEIPPPQSATLSPLRAERVAASASASAAIPSSSVTGMAWPSSMAATKASHS